MCTAALICILVAICSSLSLSTAFIPTKLLAWSVNGFNPPLRQVTTHADITRNAILQVTDTLLSDNKRARRTLKLNPLALLDEESLAAKYYGRRRQQITREFRDAIQVIVDANIKVDLEDAGFLDSVAHFDSEKFQEGQERLVKKRYNVASQIKLSNFDMARKECGQMFHSIQDFYSHTNWLENGNDEPYSILGKPGEEISHVADHSMQTCHDCENGRVVYTIDIFNTASMIFKPYSCYNNILEDLKSNGTLTSGYSDQVGMTGRSTKPLGKCSHGGFLDRYSSQQALGGINKDSPFQIWSPHYYLHEKAVALALKATVSILQDIRRDVDNDVLFGSFLGIELSPQHSRVMDVRYIIDINGNMDSKLISLISRNNKSLRVHLNGMALNIQTQFFRVPSRDDANSHSLFKSYKNSPSLSHGLGAKKPDQKNNYLLRTLDRATKSAKKNSIIYVFLDTFSSDGYYVNDIIDTIARKSIIVYVILYYSTPSSSTQTFKMNGKLKNCTSENLKLASFKQISTANGGQLLYYSKADMPSLLKFIKLATIMPKSTIFLISDCLIGTVQFSVPFDSFLEEAVISICGENVRVTVILPNGIVASFVKEYTVLISSPMMYTARVNMTPDLKGNWTISVTSGGPYNMRVMGNRKIWVSEKYYQVDPTFMYGYKAINGKMIQGRNVIAHLQLSSSEISLASANLLAISGLTLKSLRNISRTSPASYSVTFPAPDQPFLLQLNGRDQSGYHFSHITSKVIPVSLVTLSLDEGQTADVTMKPGESSKISLVLQNFGNEHNFELKIEQENMDASPTKTSSLFKYFCSPQKLSLKRKASRKVQIFLQVSNNASEGTSISLIVSASPDKSGSNNFLNIYAIVSNGPQLKQNNLTYHHQMSEGFSVRSLKNLEYFIALLLGALYMHHQLI